MSLYENDKLNAIRTAIDDLDPTSDNISLFSASVVEPAPGKLSDFDLIAFLYSATARSSDLQKLCYIDLDISEFLRLGLKIRKVYKTGKFQFHFYSSKHYEMYPMNDSYRELVAESIFKKIKTECNGEVPVVKKEKLQEVANKHSKDIRLFGLCWDELSKWAKPKPVES
ncbi:hypothetical protein [Leptospira levettii]|uniref:hypothetical protein n=1 Tax=Leptospira levettii TaxID=2023178 RepID=UPI000C2AEA2D|nr:hypothetical protein [Leptospira levettii]PJZ87416.1 hypothetical protein CH368_16870 [Leptospira levettii]